MYLLLLLLVPVAVAQSPSTVPTVKPEIIIEQSVFDTSSFADDFATVFLPRCFVVQLRNTDHVPRKAIGRYVTENAFFGKPKVTFRLHRFLPLLNVDLRKGTAVLLAENRRKDHIRFQEQCILYHVIGADYSPPQKRDLMAFFKHRSVERQSHNSYILLETIDREQDDLSVSTGISALLLNPALVNYEHRAWIAAKGRVTGAGVRLHYSAWFYCFYCKDGQEDLVHSDNYFSGRVVESLSRVFPDTSKNFNGRKMKFTAATALPFVSISKTGSLPRKVIVEGMQGVIAHAVAAQLNFTVEVLDSSKGLTGLRWKNGTWIGSVAEVLYGRSDFGLNTAVSYERYQAVDFTVAATYGFLVLIATKPSPFFEWRAIFYPFEIKAWLAISFTILLTILSYKFLLNHGSKIHKNGVRFGRTPLRRVKKSAKKWIKVKLSFVRSCYITVGSLLDQGIPCGYTTDASRVYAIFWFLFAIVTTCAYKSKLFSYLTFPVITIPPTNFYELHTSDFTWGLQSLGGLALLFITTSPVPYIRKVGEKMEKITDPNTCLDRTFTQRFVCINYKATFDYMSAVRYWKINHKFHVSDYVAPPVGSSWVVRKNSPLIHPLNKIIQGQFETGLGGFYADEFVKTTALRSRALAQASTEANDLFDMNTSYKETTQLEKPLEFANLYASFLILFFGVAIAASVLIVEFLRWRGSFYQLGACIQHTCEQLGECVTESVTEVKQRVKRQVTQQRVRKTPTWVILGPSIDYDDAI